MDYRITDCGEKISPESNLWTRQWSVSDDQISDRPEDDGDGDRNPANPVHLDTLRKELANGSFCRNRGDDPVEASLINGDEMTTVSGGRRLAKIVGIVGWRNRTSFA